MGKGHFKNAQWCPFCGVQALERDKYGETLERPNFKNEFVCGSCGKGIVIGPSTRYLHAAHIAKAHREMRPPDEPRVPKIKPADIELFTLHKYAEAIGYDCDIARSRKKVGMFVFSKDGHGVGSMDFRGAMIFLRGWEMRDKAPISSGK